MLQNIGSSKLLNCSGLTYQRDDIFVLNLESINNGRRAFKNPKNGTVFQVPSGKKLRVLKFKGFINSPGDGFINSYFGYASDEAVAVDRVDYAFTMGLSSANTLNDVCIDLDFEVPENKYPYAGTPSSTFNLFGQAYCVLEDV